MSNATPLISIIIPIYNVEDYLRKTLESVLGQSYQNLEILCVLDSPTDNSESIAIEYQQRDSRIKLIYQENQGVSVARNNGMAQATGEYFFFLDSDDWLIDNAIELLVEAALRTQSPVISGGIINVDETTQTQSVYNRKRKTGHIKLKGKHFFDLEVVVWNKLYHRSTCENIRYVPGLIHQDEEFYWQFFARNQNAYAIEQDVIYYYRRGNSITTTKRKTNEKYQLNYLTVIKSAYSLLSERPDLIYHFRKRAIKYLRKIKSKNAPCDIYEAHIAEEYDLRDNKLTKLKTDIIKLTC